jgi:hypothetical protein
LFVASLCAQGLACAHRFHVVVVVVDDVVAADVVYDENLVQMIFFSISGFCLMIVEKDYL